MPEEDRIKNLLSRNVETVIEKYHLEHALRSGKKLRIKHGIDPTGEKIHIGRAVALWKLREFQELGHKIVLIIGDFTAQIGDPSDKLEKRPFLTQEQVGKNLKNYLPQIGKIIDLKKTEVRRNSEWLKELNFREISTLADIFSVQQMAKRRNFNERWERDEEISLREFMYPLMQGYDSVAIKADVELGGSDQLFNLLAGRKIQEHYGQKPQDIMTTKMLFGLDGRKMSTSWGNVVNIADSPEEQFGKIMSMRDEQIPNYLELATDLSEGEISRRLKELRDGKNPKSVKELLAYEVAKRYHGEVAALAAADKFEKVFSRREMPEDLPELKIGIRHDMAPMTGTQVMIASGIVKSRGEARRLAEQGAFEVGGVVERDSNKKLNLKSGEVVKIGKKNFFRIKI